MNIRLIILALLAALALGLGGSAAASRAHVQPAAPDTYVDNWDGVANQAFTAASTPPQ